MWFDMNVLIPLEKVNKDYRLPFERVYGWTKMNNHGFRKKSILDLIPACRAGGIKKAPPIEGGVFEVYKSADTLKMFLS
jgi:hypothetical protein